MNRMNRTMAKNKSDADQQMDEWRDSLSAQFEASIDEQVNALKAAMAESEELRRRSYQELEAKLEASQEKLGLAIQEASASSRDRLLEDRQSVNRRMQDIDDRFRQLVLNVERRVKIPDFEAL